MCCFYFCARVHVYAKWACVAWLPSAPAARFIIIITFIIVSLQVLLSRGVAPLLVQVFRACPDSDAAANAALCVKRLAVEGPSVCQIFVAAHVIDYLVIMLQTRCVGNALETVPFEMW